MEKVPIVAKNSKTRQLEKNEYIQGNVVLLIDWISKINIKKSHFKKDKPKKGTKRQRTERHDIKGVFTKSKHQNSYVRINEIVNEREGIEA